MSYLFSLQPDMYQVINYICGDDVSLGSTLEIPFLYFLKSAQKAGDVAQELNELIAAVIMFALNNLPSAEYLWSVILRLAIFIPYVIYSQYKLYTLEKRIYELTWTLSFRLRKNMFKVVPPQSEHSLRRSSSIIKQTDCSSLKTKSSTISAPRKPRRQSIFEMGDMPTNTRIYKIKSSPALKCASRSSKLGNEKFEETYFVSMRPTKKLKRDVNDDTSVVTFQEPKSIVTKIFQKPQQTIIVEYCNVLKSTGATKYPSAVSQDMSTSLASTSVTKQNLGSYASTKSWEQRSNHENCQRKWKGITERNNAMRLERMKKLKEMELQKLQEKEKAQKTEIARRRAMIAKIREQNRKFLMEHKGWKLGGNASSDNGPSNDEIILPVVHVKANGATRNDHIDAYDFQANAPSVGNLDEEVPVLRLTQRTLTIERTAKISKLNNEGRSNEMKTKRLQMSDEMRQNVIEEKPGQIIPKCTEYYLMSKETPTKRLVYIEKKHNSSVMPSVTLANKSVSEIFTQSIETFGDLRQVRSNLKTFSSQEVFEKPVSSIRNYPPLDSENVQDNHFNSDSGDKNQTTAVISQTILNVSEPVLIISEPVGNISEPVLILSEPIENISEPNVNGIQLNINENQSNLNDIQPNLNDIQPELNNIQAPCELEQFSSVDTHPSSGSQSGDANDNAIQTGEEIIENADPPTGGEMKTTVECVTPIQTPRVESIPSPLLPNASLNSKNQNQRPIIKRARRRLQKEPSVSDSPENKIQQPEPMGAIDQKKEAIQQNEVQTESKPQNVRAYVPKSLLLKKIELKKRLEERRGACRFTPLNDSLPAGTEINQNVDQSLEETSPISTKTLIERPAATLNKPRRFSLDGNGNKTKLNQTRTPASTHPFKKCVTRKVPSTVSTMKRGSSKSQVSKQEQTVHAGKKTESPQVRKVSTPRASCNRQTSAEPNRPQSYLPIIKTEIIHTTIDGTYCRKNSVGSPSNRRLCTKNNPPANANQCLPDLASDIKTNSPDRRKNKECQGNDQNITSPKAETAPISTPKSWNASKTTQEQSTAETKLPSESDNEVIMSDNTGIITDCPKNKRSDFLAFQMDTSGHPVPVKHINDRSRICTTQTPYYCKEGNSHSSELHRTMQSSSLMKKTSLSAKNSFKEEGQMKSQDVIDENEWNKRMKIWEEKRKLLSYSRNSSKYLTSVKANECSMEAEQPRQNGEVETNCVVVHSEENTTIEICSIISLPESHNGNCEEVEQIQNEELEKIGEEKKEKQSIEESTREVNHGENHRLVKQQYLNGEYDDNKREMVKILSSTTPSTINSKVLDSTNSSSKSTIWEEVQENSKLGQSKKKRNSSKGASIDLNNNEKESSSQGMVVKNEEIINTSPKGLSSENGVNVKDDYKKVETVKVISSTTPLSSVHSKVLDSTNSPLNSSKEETRDNTKSGQGKKKRNKSNKGDSMDLNNNGKKSSLQGSAEKNQETTTSSPKGGLVSENAQFSRSVLSPIQSVSDNNYLSDGANGSKEELKSLNIKPANGNDANDEVRAKPDKSVLNQVEKSQEKQKVIPKPDKSVFNQVEKSQEKLDTNHVQNEGNEIKLGASNQDDYHQSEKLRNMELPPSKLGDCVKKDSTPQIKETKKDCKAELKNTPQVFQKAPLSEQTFDKDINHSNVIHRCGDSEPKNKGSFTCRKSQDISSILDQLLTVTRALNKERISKELNKSHSKSVACDIQNDRGLSAIICCPEGYSSYDDIKCLPGQPLFLGSSFSRKRIMNPVVVECVTSTPAEFYEKARETNDRFLNNVHDDIQKMATRIEWYEDLYNLPISSEELDTHQDLGVKCYKEVVVDRRGCKSKNNGVCTAKYEKHNYKVKRYEVHHDTSNCHLIHTNRKNSAYNSSFSDYNAERI